MHFTSIVGLLLLSVSTGQVLCHLEPQLYSGYILAIFGKLRMSSVSAFGGILC